MGRFLEWWKAPNPLESGNGGEGKSGGGPGEERKPGGGPGEERKPGGGSGEGEDSGTKGVGERRYVTLVKSLLLAALPLLCCLVYCMGQGRSLGEVYLPSSGWNDELFYYKQVEAILDYGYPQGYFGFNESHALELSFAAWSPVLVFPWIVWGLVFGWNLMSPVVCNIFLMSLCCFLFVWLVRPAWKQMGILTLLFCLYTPFVRYMLSAMAEVICFVILILFYSMAINYLRRERDYKLVLLFLVSGLMILMRPYLALFMLLPIYFLIRRGKGGAGKLRNGALGLVALAGALGIYGAINHYLGAEYFTPLFFTDWIEAFFTEGIFGGIWYTVRKLYYVGQDFLGHVQRGFSNGLASDANFVCYLVCMAVLAAQGFADWRRFRRLRAGERTASAKSEDLAGRACSTEGEELAGRACSAEGEELAGRACPAEGEELAGRACPAEGEELAGRACSAEGEELADRTEAAAAAEKEAGARKRTARQEAVSAGSANEARRVWEKMVIEIHLAFSFVAMIFALLLMYKLTEGSRHLTIFLASAVFIIAWMDTRFYKKAVVIGITFAYFYTYMALNPFDYQVPFREEESVASVEAWREAMAEALALREEDVPNYDNVVIWVYSDMVDGETVITPYQLLYGLPKGFGISCCMREYVIPNIDALQSRYIAVPAHGEIAQLCQDRGRRLVYGDEEMVLYELRGSLGGD